MSVTKQFNAATNQLTINIDGAFYFSQHAEFRGTYRNVVPDKNITLTVNLNRSDYIKQVLSISNFGKKFNIK